MLEPWLEDGIHHVGSTAIPGLAAKPIIDMFAGVHDLDEARAAFGPLREHSYAAHTAPAGDRSPLLEAVGPVCPR